MKKSLSILVERFKTKYPDLDRHGNTYIPDGTMNLIVLIPGRGKLNYSCSNDRIIWLQRYEDERDLKTRAKSLRPIVYEDFCEKVTQYMRYHKMTNQEFCDQAGISRKSLSKYLNHDSIPKLDTMRRICEKMNIDILEE